LAEVFPPSEYNAELARNPIWRHSIDVRRAVDRANGPPYEGVVLLVASYFFQNSGFWGLCVAQMGRLRFAPRERRAPARASVFSRQNAGVPFA